MTAHWTDRLFEYFYNLYDRVDYNVDSFIVLYNKKLTRLVNKYDKLVDYLANFPMHFYGLYRLLTFPTNYVIIYGWKYLLKLFRPLDILMRKGIHIIKSPPGGGKSLSAYLTAEKHYKNSGYQSYINSQFEKPRTDKNGRRYTKHIFFEFENIFGIRNVNGKLEGYQKKLFNSRKAKVVIWDEIHLMFNPRENRSSLYMLAWKPFLNNILHYRHEGFHSHIILSQLKVDIQLASIASYIHQPTTIIDINYRLWMATGQFKMVPVKIKYQTFKFVDDKMKPYRKWSRRVDYEDLEFYETLALKHTRSNIPLLN